MSMMFNGSRMKSKRLSVNETIERSASFLEILFFQCAENLGMPVIFTLASDLSEKLSIQAENREKSQQEARERKIQEEAEVEQKRFEGTRVTVETFIKWKVKFDAEFSEGSKAIKIDENEPKRLTGRQLFEKDRSLYDSDIKFISGEGQRRSRNQTKTMFFFCFRW